MILGTGIDIIEIDRIQKAIDRWGDNFINHIFVDEEIAYAKQHKHSAQHYAVRFAAKEAVFKAIGDRPNVTWKDIRITNDNYGRPCCTFSDKSFKNKILISLSHSKLYAVASAIITSDEEHP